jgi:hypothetical protein
MKDEGTDLLDDYKGTNSSFRDIKGNNLMEKVKTYNTTFNNNFKNNYNKI